MTDTPAGRKEAWQREKMGLAPARIEPDVDDRTALWLDLFTRLIPSHPIGMSGYCPLPVSELRAQTQYTPFPASNDEIQRVIQAMDEVFMEEVGKQRERDNAAA